MRPLLLFGVLYVFFVVIFKVDKANGAAGEFYGAQLLGSIVLFTFFSEATSGAVRSVVDRENLVRKIQFPRLAIPISIVLLALFNLGSEPGRGHDLRCHRRRAADAHVAGAAADSRRCWSCSLPAWRCCCRRCSSSFRDIQPIWEVFSQILFYSSPVIIPVETVRQ